MQHAWLVAACSKLGLTRYVLPQPIVARIVPRRRMTEDEVREAQAGWATRVRVAIKAWWDGGEQGKDEEVGGISGTFFLLLCGYLRGVDNFNP